MFQSKKGQDKVSYMLLEPNNNSYEAKYQQLRKYRLNRDIGILKLATGLILINIYIFPEKMNFKNPYSYFPYNAVFYSVNQANIYPFLDPRFIIYQQSIILDQNRIQNGILERNEPIVPVEFEVPQVIDKPSVVKNSTEKVIKTVREDSKKDKNFSMRNQKSTRNMNSNNLKYFVKYVRGFKQNPVVLESILASVFDVSYNVGNFSQQFQDLNVPPNYMSMKYINKILNGPNEMLSKALRILYRRFLKFDKTSFFICKTKLKKNVKKQSMKDCRELLKQSFPKK